jgi:hypothetical protein
MNFKGSIGIGLNGSAHAAGSRNIGIDLSDQLGDQAIGRVGGLAARQKIG